MTTPPKPKGRPSRPDGPTSPVSVRPAAELRARLEAMAEADDRPLASMVLILIKEAVAARDAAEQS